MKIVVILYMKLINQNSEVIQMININKQVEATAPAYMPQLHSKSSQYYNTNFFVTTVSLEKMYLNKYRRRDYQCTLNPFKVLIC